MIFIFICQKMKEIMQNSNYNDYKINSLKLKLIKNINNCVSYLLSCLCILAWIELFRLIIDLYYYFH